MRRGSSRARAIRTSRRTAWTRTPSRAAPASTSVSASRRASHTASRSATAPCCATSSCKGSSASRADGRSPSALRPDIDNSNTGRSNLGFGYNDRPNVSGDPSLDSPTADQWFNTAAFSLPAYGTFGNAGRNILTGPGYTNFNFAVVKYVPFGRFSAAAAAGRGLQPAQQHEPEPARCILGVADFRPRAVGRQPAPDTVRCAGVVLTRPGRAPAGRTTNREAAMSALNARRLPTLIAIGLIVPAAATASVPRTGQTGAVRPAPASPATRTS